MRLGLEVIDKTLGKAQTHGKRLGVEAGQRAVIKAAAVAQAIAATAIAHAGHKQ